MTIKICEFALHNIDNIKFEQKANSKNAAGSDQEDEIDIETEYDKLDELSDAKTEEKQAGVLLKIDNREDLMMVITSESLANLYGSITKLRQTPNPKVTEMLDKVVLEYIDDFSLTSLANIIYSKVITCEGKDVEIYIDAVTERINNMTLTHNDMVSLKVIIHSLSKIKTKNKTKLDTYQQFAHF